MVTANATVNLRSTSTRDTFLPLLLRIEAWLDRRAGRNALYAMDERALHDIGLSSADVDAFDPTASWQNCLGRR